MPGAWVDLDPSTAVFHVNGGNTYGQYTSGAITGLAFNGPDYYFPGLTLVDTHSYEFEFTTTTSIDLYIAIIRELNETNSAWATPPRYFIADTYDPGPATVHTVTVGPGIQSWASAVSAGYNAVNFNHGNSSHISAIRYRDMDLGPTSLAMGQASETDTANALTLVGNVVKPFGQATETDTGRTIIVAGLSDVTVALGQAFETDTAQWIAVPGTGPTAGDLTLNIPEDELDATPANILVRVGNGNDGESITFTLTGTGGPYSLGTFVVDDEDGDAEFGLVLPELAPGTYVLTAAGTASGSITDSVTVTEEPLVETPDDDDNSVPEPPDFTPDPTQHWQLIDTTIGDPHSYTFPHNPDRWTNPNKPNFLQHEVTTAPDGNVVTWEGAERSWTFEFSGFLDTQEQYEALEFWSELRRRFWLIDHRDRAHYVTFDHLDVRARIVPNKPWAHNYTVRAIHFYRDGTA